MTTTELKGFKRKETTMRENTITTIDEYIAQYPEELQQTLQTLRGVIKEEAPLAVEKMSWGMPTFAHYGNLIHFAVNKNHIGLYPAPSGVEYIKQKTNEYNTSKGAVQLPMDKPIPYELIREVVRFRVKENEAAKKK